MITVSSDLFANQGFRDLANFLNINHLGITTDTNQLSGLTKINDLNLFSRLTIKENKGINANNIKKLFANNRYKYDIITVQPVTASVAAIAARDRRVDVVRVGPESTLRVFNTRYGRRLEENGKIVEVDLSLFWNNKIAKNLRPLIRVLTSFKSCNLRYILHKDITNLAEMRSYRGLQAIGRLIDLSNNQTKISHLTDQITVNEKKRMGIIPMEGVEITEW
ncbi:MAG: hypothetical protein GPJ54_21495 [Candidatus Heimdallarchaeota archaeon]|nr:hypothetical protein [Candidatus Heimdallarchaeota archaeon]